MNYIIESSSPHSPVGLVFIQTQINPVLFYDRNNRKTSHYCVRPRNLVFGTKDTDSKRNKYQINVPSVFSNFYDYNFRQNCEFIGVSVDGSLNGHEVEKFPKECGQLAVAIKGAVSIECDTSLFKDASYGDIVVAVLEESDKLSRTTNDYKYCKLMNYSPREYKMGISGNLLNVLNPRGYDNAVSTNRELSRIQRRGNRSSTPRRGKILSSSRRGNRSSTPRTERLRVPIRDASENRSSSFRRDDTSEAPNMKEYESEKLENRSSSFRRDDTSEAPNMNEYESEKLENIELDDTSIYSDELTAVNLENINKALFNELKNVKNELQKTDFLLRDQTRLREKSEQLLTKHVNDLLRKQSQQKNKFLNLQNEKYRLEEELEKASQFGNDTKSLQTELTNVKSNIQAVNQKLSEVEQEIEKSQDEIDELKTANLTLEKTNKDLKQEINSLENQTNEIKALTKKIEEKENEIKSSKVDFNTLQNKGQKDLEVARQQWLSEKEKLLSDRNQFRDDFVKSNENFNYWKRTYDEYKLKSEAVEKQLDLANEENKNLKLNYNAKETELQELKNSLKSSGTDKDRLSSDLAKKQLEVDSIKSELDRSNAEIGGLKKSLNNYKGENEIKAQILAENETAKLKRIDQIKQLESRIEINNKKFEEKLNEAQISNENMKKKNATLISKNMKLTEGQKNIELRHNELENLYNEMGADKKKADLMISEFDDKIRTADEKFAELNKQLNTAKNVNKIKDEIKNERVILVTDLNENVDEILHLSKGPLKDDIKIIFRYQQAFEEFFDNVSKVTLKNYIENGDMDMNTFLKHVQHFRSKLSGAFRNVFIIKHKNLSGNLFKKLPSLIFEKSYIQNTFTGNWLTEPMKSATENDYLKIKEKNPDYNPEDKNSEEYIYTKSFQDLAKTASRIPGQTSARFTRSKEDKQRFVIGILLEYQEDNIRVLLK